MNKFKNENKYKILGIFLYFFSSLAGLSILFLYSPRKLLLDENKETEIIKLNLYKDFAKSIYDNINTPLIKNLILTKDNENCPKNFEKLILKNQYFGNFSKFYGNKSICIERFRGSEYTLSNFLKILKYTGNDENKKKCGKLFKNTNLYFYTSKDEICPLNQIEINSISRAKTLSNYYYNIGPEDEYFIPTFGNNQEYPVITNIEIINNYKTCLERNKYINNIFCEFPDENECFIEDNFEKIPTLAHSNNYKLNPINLAKWNLVNDNNIIHDFCNSDLNFNIFVKGYINFTERNLEQFKEEFPSNDYTNNSLYKTYNKFKSSNNIDKVFYLISYNLFIWSLIHFIFQIMLYVGKKGIRHIYIINGIILFVFKLISLFGIIINYYCFYLKIEKVYIEMIDKPRNKVLEYYNNGRKYFIIKIIIICLIGFFILCFDFVVLIFTIIIQWGYYFNEEKMEGNITENKDNKINTKIDAKLNIKINSKMETKIDSKIETKKDTKIESKTRIETKDDTKTGTKENNQINNHIVLNNSINDSYGEPNFSYKFDKIKVGVVANENDKFNKNIFNPMKKIKDNPKIINLYFTCKDNLGKSYLIQIGENEPFMKAIQILKETYPELKEKNMILFLHGSKIVNKEKSIFENDLKDNQKIIIIPK